MKKAHWKPYINCQLAFINKIVYAVKLSKLLFKVHMSVILFPKNSNFKC